jgi:hypothetical protein
MKKVHVASNDTAPLVFPLVARAMAPPITPAPTLRPARLRPLKPERDKTSSMMSGSYRDADRS